MLLALAVAVLTRGCSLPSWVRLPAPPATISAATLALQQEDGLGGGSSEGWADAATAAAASSLHRLRAPALPPAVCALAARALYAAPGAAAPVPLLALLALWHAGAALLLGGGKGASSEGGGGGGGGGVMAQLPRVAVGARVAWNVTRDVGVVLVVLGAAACLEQAWGGQ